MPTSVVNKKLEDAMANSNRKSRKEIRSDLPHGWHFSKSGDVLRIKHLGSGREFDLVDPIQLRAEIEEAIAAVREEAIEVAKEELREEIRAAGVNI